MIESIDDENTVNEIDANAIMSIQPLPEKYVSIQNLSYKQIFKNCCIIFYTSY